MVFDHIVKYNGIYYKAGENVPMEEEEPKEEPKVEKEEVKKKSASSLFPDGEEKPKRRGRPKKE